MGEDVVVLIDVHTPAEREIVAGWAAREHPGAPVVEQGDAALADRLTGNGDPLVLPARVTWLPAAAGNGTARTTSAGTANDFVALLSPRRPPAQLQKWIARRAPERARVTAGEPARATALQDDFRRETGGRGGREAFAAFVGRRATLACDRAARALIGDRYKVPRLVAEQIVASAGTRARVDELADRLGRTTPEVLDELTADLRELAAVQSPPAIDAFRAAMGPLHRRAWNVEADVEGLERLRELNRKSALIFLPSHRSYADPLVLADVLHEHDFPRNHVLGGNNMSFWPIGPLGKRAGLIFIRRSFGDDDVYKLAVREYFGHLAAKRFNLEWYIEGGRSRTGKLRPPRYGLLRYLVRALEDGHAQDVQLVPVSIAYEQLQEVGLMAAEQGGAAKSGEGLGWLAGYLRAQSRNAGVARVRFGVPLSLRTALDDAGEGSAQLEKVAFRICVGINRVSPVTSSSLVTATLLGVEDRALTLDQVRQVITPALDYLEARGVQGPLEDLRRTAALRRALDAVVTAGVVTRYDEGTEPVWRVSPDQHHVAAFYRNGAVHHFVNRAIVELVLQRGATMPQEGDPTTVAWEEALRLRDLFKFEFFFARKIRFQEELLTEMKVLGWREDDPELTGWKGASKLLSGAPLLIARGVLQSFADAQLVVAERLCDRDPRSGIDRDELLGECLHVGHQMLLQGRVVAPEAISRELFVTALRLADNRDILDPGRDEVAEGRRAWLAEVEDVRTRLAAIAVLARTRLEEVIGGVAG